jgi:hypothetical protein
VSGLFVLTERELASESHHLLGDLELLGEALKAGLRVGLTHLPREFLVDECELFLDDAQGFTPVLLRVSLLGHVEAAMGGQVLVDADVVEVGRTTVPAVILVEDLGGLARLEVGVEVKGAEDKHVLLDVLQGLIEAPAHFEQLEEFRVGDVPPPNRLERPLAVRTGNHGAVFTYEASHLAEAQGWDALEHDLRQIIQPEVPPKGVAEGVRGSLARAARIVLVAVGLDDNQRRFPHETFLK